MAALEEGKILPQLILTCLSSLDDFAAISELMDILSESEEEQDGDEKEEERETQENTVSPPSAQSESDELASLRGN